MNNQNLKSFADQMLSGLNGLTSELNKSLKEVVSKMSKEDAENYAKALNDPKLKEMAEKIVDLNKKKE